MGVGIDVSGRKLTGRSNGNEKTFTMMADVLTGKADDPYHEYAGPRAAAEGPYSERDEVCKRMVWWLSDRYGDVLLHEGRPVSGDFEHVPDEAFRDGSLYTEMTIWIGQDVQQRAYTEVTKDGWYLYPSAKDMDEHDHSTAIYMDNAMDAVNTHVATAVAKAERLEARKAFVKNFCMEEQHEKDRIKRQLKNNPEDAGLKEQLGKAQEALDNKKAAVHEDPAYKALLVPGKNESIAAVSGLMDDDFSEAVEAISTKQDGLCH